MFKICVTVIVIVTSQNDKETDSRSGEEDYEYPRITTYLNKIVNDLI